jgi:D-amino-acid dehydrogenase
MSSKRIVILGGGIVGLATAWHCIQRGHAITVIDRRSQRRDGCSFGNAGMVVPSHFIPLAAPGMIRLGLKWMFHRESPFAIRPRLSWDLIQWLWAFQSSCTAHHVAASAPLLRDLSLASRQGFIELESQLPDDFGLVRKGLMMLCKTDEAWREEVEVAEQAEHLGIEAQVLDRKQANDLDPGVDLDVRGAVYFPLDCHLSPNRLMSSLESALIQRGCQFLWDTECVGFETRSQSIRSLKTTQGDIDGDEFVICGGAWSGEIGRLLGLRLRLQAGKGYSMTLEGPPQLPEICSILKEARVAVTPMGSSLRFGGTMEIVGTDSSISPNRLRGIVRSIPEYFPRFRSSDFDGCQPWVGLRPCSPDGLPYLGRTSKWSNLLVSTGHGMMGISLSMISGQIVGEMIDGMPPRIPHLHLLSPDR